MNINKTTDDVSEATLAGGCLCGEVTYQVNHQFDNFYICHCRQCQQLTGSAFAANIFTAPGNIEWLSGHEVISEYQHPSREFSKAFCAKCGSALPFLNKSGQSLIIPAGSLFDAFEKTPDANIFVNEEAPWLKTGLSGEKFDNFPG